MRILQVGSGITPKTGGGELYTYLLSKALSQRNEVYVFYPSYSTYLSQKLVKKNRDNITFYELQLPIWYYWSSVKIKTAWKFKPVEEKFKEVLNEIDPDVVHFHGLWRLKSAKIIDIAKSLGIPTVITLHAYWFICPLGSLLDYKGNICSGPQPEKCRICWSEKIASDFRLTSIPLGRSILNSLVKNTLLLLNSTTDFQRRTLELKKILLNVDRIIAPSKFLKNIFVQYGIPSRKIIFSENGYPLEIFDNFKKKQKESDRIIFGFVGGISKHKGVHVLIDAFLKVPPEKAELRIYGNYNPNSEYVKGLLSKIRQAKNIKFMGKFQNVTEPYSEIDVLVFPSIWYENCPLVLAEARATKTPIIASNIGAIPEFVKDGQNGLLFIPGDSKDLYNKIMYIINNPVLLKEFRNNINPPKSIYSQAKEIEEIYKNIIG